MPLPVTTLYSMLTVMCDAYMCALTVTIIYWIIFSQQFLCDYQTYMCVLSVTTFYLITSLDCGSHIVGPPVTTLYSMLTMMCEKYMCVLTVTLIQSIIVCQQIIVIVKHTCVFCLCSVGLNVRLSISYFLFVFDGANKRAP